MAADSYQKSLLVILINLFCVNGHYTEKCGHIVNVMRSSSTKCDKSSSSVVNCPSLEKALELKDLSFTCVKVFTSSEQLSNQHAFTNVNNLMISGVNTTSPTAVTCKAGNSSKVSFVDSNNIFIRRLSFNSCGGAHQNDFVITKNTRIMLSSAVYFRNVTGLVINDTTFSMSRGYSVVMADVVNGHYHRVNIFSNKAVPFEKEENLSYGGGILTFLSDAVCGEVNELEISNSLFYFINATDSAKTQSPFTQGQGDAIIDSFKKTFLGKGGGLSFYLQSQHILTNISIKSCQFYLNRAFWGGGIYLEFGEYAHRNHIEINDTQLVDNFANFSGGALQIIKKAQNNSVVQQNNVYISYNLFTGNEAEVGGGLAQVYGLKNLESGFQANQGTKIVYCELRRNKAHLGSAVYVDRASVLLHMVNITINTLYNSHSTLAGPSLSTVMGLGALYSFQSHVVINGTAETPSRVSGNLNTGFVLDYSYLYVLGKVIFENNQGSKGGAISIYEESAIYLFDSTSLHFVGNKANKGGALYVYFTGPSIPIWTSPELNVYKCFFRFDKTTSRKSFNGSVSFNCNEALENNGDAIFANLLQSCKEPGTTSSSQILRNWTNFNFTGNSKSLITTDPVSITVNETQWENVSPGIQFSTNINLIDEMGYNVDSTIEITFEPEENVFLKNNKNSMIVTNNTVELKILGDRNANFNVTIRTPQGRALPLKIVNKRLKDCPFAYSYSHITKSCDCLNVKNQDRMISRCIGKDIYLYKQVWAYFNQSAMHTDDETTQVCPRGYCNQSCGSSEDSVDCKYDTRYQCAENRDQSPSNYLCAKCAHNYSVAFGSEKCIDCRDKHQWWKALLIFAAIPCVVIGILWLNIDVYKLFLNSLIFFYQVVFLFFTPNLKTDPVMQAIMGGIDLRGLGFSEIGFCLFDNLNDLEKNMINYAIPLLMILTLVFIIVFAEQCPCTLPFEQVNTFRAILFVLVWAYSDVTRITLNTLKVVEINEVHRVEIYAAVKYMRGEHLYYAIPAVFILVVFVIGVPIFLIAPSVLMAFEFQICDCWIHNRFYTSFIKPLLESFLSVFNNNLKCHLFSAFYFLFRLILLIMSACMARDQFQLTMKASFCFIMLLLFSKVKPYQDDYYNYFDMLILLNLTIIAFWCTGKLRVPLFNVMDNVTEYVVNGFLWMPLLIWVIFLFVKYKEKKKEKERCKYTRIQ